LFVVLVNGEWLNVIARSSWNERYGIVAAGNLKCKGESLDVVAKKVENKKWRSMQTRTLDSPGSF
jgi:hypothetical protein